MRKYDSLVWCGVWGREMKRESYFCDVFLFWKIKKHAGRHTYIFLKVYLVSDLEREVKDVPFTFWMEYFPAGIFRVFFMRHTHTIQQQSFYWFLSCKHGLEKRERVLLEILMFGKMLGENKRRRIEWKSKLLFESGVGVEDGESLGGLVEMMKQIGHAFTLFVWKVM